MEWKDILGWIVKGIGLIWLIWVLTKIENSIIDFYDTIKNIEAYLKRIANKIDPDGDLEKLFSKIVDKEKKKPSDEI